MSEQIRAGDLVMVVRWPHEHEQIQLGRIYSVIGFDDAMVCPSCSMLFIQPCASVRGPKKNGNLPLAWLKRIDPPSEPERVETDETVNA